jgi:hypothetical protein
MKANIIKEGAYKGMRFTKGLVYSVSEPTYAALCNLGLCKDERRPVEVKKEEVKAPKVKAPTKTTKEQKFMPQTIGTAAPKVTGGMLTEETNETNESNEA